MRQPVLLLVVATLLLGACATPSDAQTTDVVVVPIGDDDGSISREELDDHIRRFSDRYYTRVALAVDLILAQSELDQQMRTYLQGWRTIAQATAVDIAIGPNPVTNLFDMMVLTTLGRMVIEDYWIPEVFGDQGRPLVDSAVILEEDIWTVADDVLSPEQKEDLLFLVTEWHENNPDQVYPWLIRMSEFSGQRAAALEAVKQSGGLLKEVARARETAEELQAFGERVLFYLQRAPGITANTMESSVMQLLGGPEVTNVLHNTDRFVLSVERLVDVIANVPAGRLAAVDQFIEGVSAERQAFMTDLSEIDDDMRPVLEELHEVLLVVERIVTANEGAEASEPIDIAEYRALTAEAAATAVELRHLVDAIGRVVDDSPAVVSVIDELVLAEERIVNRMSIIIMLLIVFFFVCLLIYKYTAARMLPK
jgi:hypothetical protein